MVAQIIADIIEREGAADLREEHADNVTPRGETAGLFVDTVSTRELSYQMRRNKIAYLAQDA